MFKSCEKCGTVIVARNRLHKFCSKCSSKAKRPPRDVTCCHCGKIYGTVPASNRTRELNKEPCEVCKPIIERKQVAQSIKRKRVWKQEMSHFGKFLLTERDRQMEICKSFGLKDSGEQLYTPMRYVSEEEIHEAKKEYLASLSEYWKSRWSGKGLEIRTLSTNGVLGFDGWITESGNYRVQKKRVRGMFITRCVGGIPSNYRCDAFQSFINKKRDSSFKFREFVNLKARKERAKKAFNNDRKHSFLDRPYRDHDSISFFQALTMTGTVK